MKEEDFKNNMESSKHTALEYNGHTVSWRVGDTLRHHSGRVYRIYEFLNTSVDETEKFKHCASYVNKLNGTKWVRPIHDMVGKFEVIED